MVGIFNVYIDTYGDSDFNNFSYIHVFDLIILFFFFYHIFKATEI